MVYSLDVRWLNTHLHAHFDRCVGVINIRGVINDHVCADRHVDAHDNEVVQQIDVTSDTETRTVTEQDAETTRSLDRWLSRRT